LNKRARDLPQNCTNFGKFILKKIIKIAATRCHILKLKCTKFDFGWGSAPDPARELTALPQTPSWIQRGLLLREREGMGGKGDMLEGEGVKGRGQERKGTGCLLLNGGLVTPLVRMYVCMYVCIRNLIKKTSV